MPRPPGNGYVQRPGPSTYAVVPAGNLQAAEMERAAKFRKLRCDHRLTLRDLARSLGMKASDLFDLETGKVVFRAGDWAWDNAALHIRRAAEAAAKGARV